MAEKQQWKYCRGKIANFIGEAPTRDNKGIVYQFMVEAEFPTGKKNALHEQMIAYNGTMWEKNVEALTKLFPTWNHRLFDTDPDAAAADLFRVFKELGSVDPKEPMPESAWIPCDVAFIVRPWQDKKTGETRFSRETKGLFPRRNTTAAKADTASTTDLAAAKAAAFGKAPPPPARAARPAPAPKAVAYPPNADGGWNAYCAAGQPADAFWPRVLEFTGVDNPDKITADGWRQFIESLTAERSATPPPAPVVPNPVAKDDADSQLPF